MIWLTELWVIRAMRILAFYQRLVLKMWALSSILSRKPSIWLVGVWPLAAGNDQMIEALNLIQDHLFVGIFPALQEAGIATLLDPKSEEAIAQLNATYDSRRDAFVQAAAKIGWKAFPSKGSFYAWMPVPEGYTSESFADLLLEKVHVAAAPGKGFGPAGDAYVRIGLLVEPERLVEAVDRIANLHLFNN